MAATQDHLIERANAQADEVDVAAAEGRRSSRAVLGLSLAAIAAVMVALAGIIGSSRAGRIALMVAGVALVSTLVLVVITL